MKVLIVGQLPVELGGNYTTGIARVVGELCKQKFENIELYVYATNLKESKAREVDKILKVNKILGYRICPWGMIADIIKHPFQTVVSWCDYFRSNDASIFHLEFFRYNFERIIKDIRPDLINFHSSGIIAMHYANIAYKIPILYTLHGLMWSGEIPENKQEKMWKKDSEMTLPLADFYTTLNEKAFSKMEKLGVRRDKVTIIPNGVDTNKFFFSEEARQKYRKQFGVGENTLVFITVGVVIDRKGQFSFLKILEKLDIDFQYWIVGQGPDYNLIKNYAQQKHIESKVKLIGYLQDTEIYKYHSAADFYAHASTVEGQALSEIEAYTTGLRVIVNRLISDTVIGDISDNYKYYIADFDDVDKEKLTQWLFTTKSERKTESKYDWSVIADQYAQTFIKCKN